MNEAMPEEMLAAQLAGHVITCAVEHEEETHFDVEKPFVSITMELVVQVSNLDGIKEHGEAYLEEVRALNDRYFGEGTWHQHQIGLSSETLKAVKVDKDSPESSLGDKLQELADSLKRLVGLPDEEDVNPRGLPFNEAAEEYAQEHTLEEVFQNLAVIVDQGLGDYV